MMAVTGTIVISSKRQKNAQLVESKGNTPHRAIFAKYINGIPLTTPLHDTVFLTKM
jgi:hypothetical protein